MTARLQNTIALTAVVYTAWMSFGLWWRYQPTPPETLANVLIGVLFGLMFGFLSDPRQMRPAELALQVASSAMLFALFALFSIRALVWPYIGEQALHGAGLGAVMWLLGYVSVGNRSDALTEKALAAAVGVGGLLLAPLLAEWLFSGALFVAVAVGARLFSAVTFPRLDLEQQGFAFGVVVGISAVAVPGIGYFAYGAF